MILSGKTTFNDLYVYLKGNYQITPEFFKNNKKVRNDKIFIFNTNQIKYLEIKESTKILDIEVFFKKESDIKIVVRNKNGFKVASNITLKDASIINPNKDDTDTKLSVIREISLELNYKDKDWIKCLFQKAAYKATDFQEFKDIIDTLIDLFHKSRIDNIFLLEVLNLICRNENEYNYSKEKINELNINNSILLENLTFKIYKE